MKQAIRSTVILGTFAATIAFGSASASSDRELLFSAPIQKVDHGAGTVTVLGQSFSADTAQLTVGEVVKVYGVLRKDGSVGDSVVEGTDKFGSNGDPVFLKGLVINADPAVGEIQIDGLTIDYTSQLANSHFAIPGIGDVVAVAGLQPTSQGLLVADATGDAAYSGQASSAGSALPVATLNNSLASLSAGAVSQNGSGTASQNGSGTASQNGSGTASQNGSGTASQNGSGTASQNGSGTASQNGSGTASQNGSGTASAYGRGRN